MAIHATGRAALGLAVLSAVLAWERGAEAQAPARTTGYYHYSGGRYYYAPYAAPNYRPAPRYYDGYRSPSTAYGYSRPYQSYYAAPMNSNGFAPGSIYYQADSPFVRDYSTARDLPFAKPWMRP